MVSGVVLASVVVGVAAEKAEVVVHSEAMSSAPSCNSVCQQSGGVFGQIIGTAPFCGASCDGDCGHGALFCFTSSKDAGLVDYGEGCATGDKVCCCIGSGSEGSFSVVIPEQADAAPALPEPTTQEKAQVVVHSEATSSAPSCNSVCQQSGGVFGQIIGTAPFCGASCDGDCGHGALFCFTSSKDAGLVDYGEGCATGDKVCCCIGGGSEGSFSVVIPEPVETVPALPEPATEAKAQVVVHSEATASAPSCNSVCQQSGGVFGQIIGTAPFCGASCDGDCGHGALFCFTSSKDAGLVDYGEGCATGDKVCCCIGGGSEQAVIV